MSRATACTIPVDWVVVTSELGPEYCVDFKLGYAFNDLWTLMLLKKLHKKGFNVRLSIVRKRGEQRVMAIIKLKFTDLCSNKSSNVLYVKKFNHIDETKGIYDLSKDIRQILIRSKRIKVTGEVSFHLNLESGPVASAQTLTTLSSDLKKLCCSDIFSDVILRCGSEVFTAHKNILATRCPVFDDILRNNTGDNTGKIEIKDLEPHVFKAVLQFIYAGDTDPLTFQSACELLNAADKYSLYELKTLCVNHITSSLTIENVLNYYQTYEIAKTYALEFISRYILEIKQTKQWLNFKREFPDLVSELGDTPEVKHWKDIKQEFQGNSRQGVEDYYHNYSTTSKWCKDITGDSSGSSEPSKDIQNESQGTSKYRKGIKREFSGTPRYWEEQEFETWF